MKRIAISFILLLPFLHSYTQTWTDAQLDSADTAGDISYLTEIEKDAIQYINLARLYPQLFITYELENYMGVASAGENLKNSSFKKSLIKQLKTQKPAAALQFDKGLYDLADCFAKESGDKGLVTHKRKRCSYGYSGECCCYGVDTGKDIAIEWLIDDKVDDLGHRVNCLNKDYSFIGLAFHSHKKYRFCAVADFR
ncbi:MAG: CAP domain-containing protein [Bacteroidota bacterium]